MSIEGIKSAGLTYQAVTSNTVTRQTAESQVEANSIVNTAEQLAAKTVDFTVKETGTEAGNNNPADQKASFEAVKKAVNEINRQNPNSTVQFGVHEETNKMTVKILDKSTRKVLKEFPAEKSLDLIAKAWEMAGIMVDEER